MAIFVTSWLNLINLFTVVVEIGFENDAYTVNEDVGSAELCVILSGRIERGLLVTVTTATSVTSGI